MTLKATDIAKDPNFIRLKTFVISMTGLSYFEDKSEQLSDRLLKRFIALGEKDCESYRKRLEFGSAAGTELDLLITELTIGETYFFRHGEQFDALRQVIIPDLLQKNKDSKRLSIWCAGCSTGAEPFSISIMLRREFKQHLVGWTIDIIGSDINRSFLDRAIEGRFDEWHLRSTGDDLRKACFQKVDKQWQINPEFKDGVSFVFHNLISSAYPPKISAGIGYDMILCRNVMIYFSQETIADILPQFNRCLVPAGWMLLGYSEINTELYKDFELVPFPGAIIFRKNIHRIQSYDIASLAKSLPAGPATYGTSMTPAPYAPPPRPAAEVVSTPALPSAAQGSTLRFPISGDMSPVRVAPTDLHANCRAALDRADFNTVLETANALIAKDQLDACAHLLKAQALLQLKREDEAEDILKKAIYINRNFIMAHYLLGMLYSKLRQNDKAARYLANAKNLLEGLKGTDLLPEGHGMSVADLQQNLKSMGGAA